MMEKYYDLDTHPDKEGWYWVWDSENGILPCRPTLFFVYKDVDWYARTTSDVGEFIFIANNATRPLCWYGPINFHANIFEGRHTPHWFPNIEHGKKVKAWDPEDKESFLLAEYVAYIPEEYGHLVCTDDRSYFIYKFCEEIREDGCKHGSQK